MFGHRQPAAAVGSRRAGPALPAAEVPAARVMPILMLLMSRSRYLPFYV
eukprot:COSAG01_NODE_65764_length_272_cov_0.763006_1_plen_48_part_10